MIIGFSGLGAPTHEQIEHADMLAAAAFYESCPDGQYDALAARSIRAVLAVRSALGDGASASDLAGAVSAFRANPLASYPGAVVDLLVTALDQLSEVVGRVEQVVGK